MTSELNQSNSSDKNLTFQDLGLIPSLLSNLQKMKYSTPTPIQAQSIPALLQGRDLLGIAQTGTGKTAAFALPLLQRLIQNKDPKQSKRKISVLVLAPTRELAVQIHQSFKDYGAHLPLNAAVIFGGVGQGAQVQQLARGVDILIATPGRLLDLIDQRYIDLSSIQAFVLDEADRMLDMGFLPDVKKVLPLMPLQRQNLFFSATMPKEVHNLAKHLLREPLKVEVAPVSSTAERIDQSVIFVDKSRKKDALLSLVQQPSFYKVIVFVRMKFGANRLADFLNKHNVMADAIHGDKSQNARQRALENLRNNKIQVLVATDLAARGIDIDDISHVINFELPHESESYVHRIGRTARAGNAGIAISLCDAEEKAFLRDIERVIGRSIPVDRTSPFHSEAVDKAPIVSKGKAKAKIEQGRSSKGRRPKNGFRFKKR